VRRNSRARLGAPRMPSFWPPGRSAWRTASAAPSLDRSPPAAPTSRWSPRTRTRGRSVARRARHWRQTPVRSPAAQHPSPPTANPARKTPRSSRPTGALIRSIVGDPAQSPDENQLAARNDGGAHWAVGVPTRQRYRPDPATPRHHHLRGPRRCGDVLLTLIENDQCCSSKVTTLACSG